MIVDSQAAVVNVLMDLETQLVSLEMTSWEDDQATAVTCAVFPAVLIPVPR
jgi:hypothetical protein